jgi:hypothetical protein
MYYRVAIRQQGDQLNRPPSWQWKSTVLSSLQALFQFLRLYGTLPQGHLRIFSSSSRGSLEEQLAQENKGLNSHSVTAAQFLHERMIRSPEVTQGAPEREVGEYQETASIAASIKSGLTESGRAAYTLDEEGKSSLERRWLELELSPGGDHNVPYSFALPASVPQVLAWMSLLARVHRGELEP